MHALFRMFLLCIALSPGQMTAPSRCGVVFQEDRLCEDYSAVTNVELATGDRAGAEEALGLLLPQEASKLRHIVL